MFSEILHPRSGHFGNFGDFGNFGNSGNFGHFGHFGNPDGIRMPFLEIWIFWNSVRIRAAILEILEVSEIITRQGYPFWMAHISTYSKNPKNIAFLYSTKTFPQTDIAYSSRSCNPVVTMMLATESSRSLACSSQRLAHCK